MRTRILIAEDSATQAEALSAVLEQEYDITLARSGEEALDKLAAGGDAYDLVLSDVMMPGITGYELCRRIKADPPLRRTPVVLLTSLGNPLDIIRGLEAGADNYITKPYGAEHLLNRLRHVLENTRVRRSLKTSMGVTVNFLGNELTITSDKEQILDLLLSSIEDVIRANHALEESQRRLADAHAELETYATRMEREAHLSNLRYGALMRSAGEAIFVLDAGGLILEANPRASELLRRAPGEMVGQRLADHVREGDRESFSSDLANAAGGRGGSSAEMVLLGAGGAEIWCEVTASTASVDAENLVLVIAHDVTDVRQAHERLRRREDLLRTLIDASPAAIFSVDMQKRVQIWNRAAEEIFGWTASEIRGHPLPIIPEDRQDEFARIWSAVLEGRESGAIELRRRRKDGSEVEISLSAAPLEHEDGEIRGVVAVILDISERARAREALRASEEQLRQAQKMEAVGRLAGGVAHDFNNILTAIKGNTQMLLMDTPADDPRREDLEEIHTAVGRATNLTRQLLTFSRKEIVESKLVNLNELIRGVEKMLQRVLRENIELRMRLDPDLRPIEADPGHLEQILMNLVVNARDAMPRGGSLTIATEMEVPERQDGGGQGNVILRVADTGEGIPPEIQPKVFEPFFTTKPQGQGTGIGLSTVYGIVQQWHGGITLHSQPGEGTEFRISLPAVEGAPSERKEDAAAPSAVLPRMSVLLVEDEPAVRGTVQRLLERSGHTVSAIEKGSEAIELCERTEERFDLLISDVVMPDMNGPELAEKLRPLCPGMRVLFTSGYSEDTISSSGVLSPGVEFIQKPFSLEALTAKIGEMFG